MLETDLIHNARHLCTRSRIDGIKAMSRGISGGKQVIKFANTIDRSQVFFIPSKRDDDSIVIQNVHEQDLRHYYLP